MDSSLREPLVNAGASSAARAHASAADRDDRASSVDAGRAASAREPLVDAEDGGEAGARNGASSPSSSSSHGHLKLLFLLASLSGSAWGRFGQLFYLEKGLSTVQIGAIEGLMPLVGVVAASGWAVVADKARSRKTVYLLTTTLSTITLLLLAWSALVQRSFVRILAVSIAYRFFTSSGILDAYALGCLGDNGAAYGRLRLFGSIGWGGGALIMGAINHRWGFSPNFVIFGTTNALLVLACVVNGHRVMPLSLRVVTHHPGVRARALRASGRRPRRRRAAATRDSRAPEDASVATARDVSRRDVYLRHGGWNCRAAPLRVRRRRLGRQLVAVRLGRLRLVDD